MKDDDWYAGGTGAKLTRATIIVAGVAALSASLLSAMYVSATYAAPESIKMVERLLLT